MTTAPASRRRPPLGVPLREDPGSLEAIRARFGSRGFPMPELNRVQARVPEGAEVLPNRAGTAPGVFARTPAGHCLILLPGPPSELRAMFETAVRPRLEEEPDRGGRPRHRGSGRFRAPGVGRSGEDRGPGSAARRGGRVRHPALGRRDRAADHRSGRAPRRTGADRRTDRRPSRRVGVHADRRGGGGTRGGPDCSPPAGSGWPLPSRSPGGMIGARITRVPRLFPAGSISV